MIIPPTHEICRNLWKIFLSVIFDFVQKLKSEGELAKAPAYNKIKIHARDTFQEAEKKQIED
jgi:hypothetical protein